MKICVLTPSERYRYGAGARIRYLRIEKMLSALGHSIRLLPIENFRPERTNDFDVFLLSKCYDSRGISVAMTVQNSGKLIGVDFFDDKFSQIFDSRLLLQRDWMRTVAHLSDFALCSTPTMAAVVAEFWPDKPSHLMNDPFGAMDLRDLAKTLDAKLQSARRGDTIRVAWFGQGDNPRFPVGLRDLEAFGEAIGVLSNAHSVDLKILTNRRSLTADGLQRIHALPARVEVEEWSETSERRLLDESLIAFIPVNAQPFSAAKSMNRAVTALTSGAQVLSTGYPLYEAFGDFIYTDSKDLVRDLTAGTLRMRRATLAGLAKRMTDLGSPAVEAAQLSAFLEALLALRPANGDVERAMPPIGVLHGIGSPNDCHRSIQRLGHFSIAGPFSRQGPRYDIWIDDANGVTAVHFSERLLPHLADGLSEHVSIRTVEDRSEVMCHLPLSALAEKAEAALVNPRSIDRAADAIPGYEAAMSKMQGLCRKLAPSLGVIVSEGDSAFSALLYRRAEQ